MKSSPLILRYGLAVMAVGVALLLKLLLDPLTVQDTPFLLVFSAVMVSAWYGGLGPGLLATALAALVTDYFFLLPVNSFTGFSPEVVPLLTFVLEGLLICLLVEALRSARQRAEKNKREAENHQESLRESEERFRLTIESVKDYAIFMLDTEGRVTSWNEGAERINGYREKEILGQHFSIFYTEEDLERDHPMEELRLAVAEGRYEEEGRRARKDGTEFWASVLITALRNREGTLRGFSKVVRDITERKEAEQALEASERRFRALVQHSSDVITVIDANGIIRYVSPAVERVMGYSPNDLVGTDVYDYVRPDNLKVARRIFAEIWSRPGLHPPFEFRVPHKDGSWRRSEFLLNNLLDDPSVRGIVVNQRDVTERKEAEIRLRESARLYRAVVENAAENIFLVDAETKRILQTNTALNRSLGYTPEELKEMTLYDVVAADRDGVDRNVERIREGGTFAGERCYRRKDGTLMDVEVSASSISYGGREAMCVVAHDVTERKRSEVALRRGLDALLALYEAGQILSSSLERVEIGEKLLEITQRVFEPAAAAIDLREGEGLRTWRTVGTQELLVSARYAPIAEEARRAVLETGEHRLFDLDGTQPERLVGLLLPLRVRDETIGLLEIYGQPSLTEGDVVETCASLANQAASALENARLYEELAQSERQLHELVGRLLTAQEEERRRVAYDIHDGLAQTAAAAHQYLQGFARHHPPDTVRGREELEEALEMVQTTVGEARQVISHLRPTTLDDFGLAAAIQQQVSSLRAEGRQVEYTQALGDGRLPAQVETTLFRIAQEALTNVRKHAGPAAAVRVALERINCAVRLSVKDDGSGFRPVDQTNGGGQGERIGLSGMRERVSLLGGRLEIHSEPGTGTSIMAEISLPKLEGTTDYGSEND